MCDPISLALTSGVKKAFSSGGGGAPAAADPEVERMKAEAEAATSANRKLAFTQARRREQQSLIARGAPEPTLGDPAATSTASDVMGTVGNFFKRARNMEPTLVSRGSSSYSSSSAAYGGGSTKARPTTPPRSSST